MIYHNQTNGPYSIYIIILYYVIHTIINSNLLFLLPHINSCFGNSAFSVALPNLWNLLPNTIRMTISRSQFKSRLFIHYLVN